MKRWIIPIVFFVITAAAAAILYVNRARPVLTAAATHGDKARPPKVEITEPLVYDFGRASQMQTGAHAWVVKNVGDVDLVIWAESSTNSCRIAKTVSDDVAAGIRDPRTRLKPNETTQIEVQWNTKRFVDSYSRACVIGTNDPQRPVISLSVRGIVDREGSG
jgi:hypothetical protein